MADADRLRWDERYRAESELRPPSSLITSCATWLPQQGRALDVAGGSGRHAIWLAQRGLAVTLCDISPTGLELATRHSQATAVALDTQLLDLDIDPMPTGPWQVVLSFHFLVRSLFPALVSALAPGGLLLFVQPTMRNLERHPRPGPAHLLAEGELRNLANAHPLEIIDYQEGWLAEGRHEARLVARRPPLLLSLA